MTASFEIRTAFGELDLHATVQMAGRDVVVTIGGGECHVGAVAIAQPRPSLSTPGSVSASSSVICVVGHKEDMLAKAAADRLAARLRATVVVVAGIHWDGLTPNDIATIDRHARALTDLVVQHVQARMPA